MVTEKRRLQLQTSTRRYKAKNRELCLFRVREIKKRWIQERRCTSCGIKLIWGENKTCINCGYNTKGEMKYAKDLQRTTKNI
jgi:hypothetical protein